jgi:hypothetical protein
MDDFLDSAGNHSNFLVVRGLMNTRASQNVVVVANVSRQRRSTGPGGVHRPEPSPPIVISGTGSGKTVIVPKVLSKALERIAITNPRRHDLANAEFAAKCSGRQARRRGRLPL